MDINGASALVTGGASGLGAATARTLIAAGARVLVADIASQEERARALGAGATFLATDVTDESQVVAAVDAARALGPLRVVVNCAGVADQHRLIGSKGVLDIDNLRRIVDVNFIGTVSVMAHGAAAMTDNEPIDGDRGVVVNVASIAGLDSSSVGYGGAKAAVAGITLAAATELSHRGIRVVAIAPGVFDTAMVAGMSSGARAMVDHALHPGRPGRPEEFASLVLHIVDNPMLNGEVIRLDSGLRALSRVAGR